MKESIEKVIGENQSMTKIISDWLVIISANYCEDCEYLVEAEYRSFVASKKLKAMISIIIMMDY